MESGEKLQDIEAHQGAILSCRASPDGCLFATTSADGTAKVQHLLTHIVTGRDVSVCGACNNLTYYTSVLLLKPPSELITYSTCR